MQTQPMSKSKEEIDRSISFRDLQAADELDCTVLNTDGSSDVNHGHPVSENEVPHEILDNEAQKHFTFQRAMSLFQFDLRRHFVLASLIIALLSMYFGNLLTSLTFWIGILNGLLLAYIILHIHGRFTKPQKKQHLYFPDYKELPSLSVPLSAVQEPAMYEGWMNELTSYYSPESFKLNSTISVYVCLQGKTLKLFYPKKNISRRAMWSEKKENFIFTRHTERNITGALIKLLPKHLPGARKWNKKYPLCIMFPKSKDKKRSPSIERSCHFPDVVDSIQRCPSSQSLPSSLSGSPAHQALDSVLNQPSIYLFARADREKEEWYWRLYYATQPDESFSITAELSTSDSDSYSLASVASDPSLPITSLTEDQEDFRNRKKPTLHFDHYMGILFNEMEKNGQAAETDHDKLPSCNVQWLNVFLGRLFYDFFTQECWLVYVKDKIQTKLNRIKMPKFMDELLVVDVYLGTSLPQIRRTSEPKMDYRGMWLDLDIDYAGGFQMTLETKINLTGIKRNSPSAEQSDKGSSSDISREEKNLSYDSEDSVDEDDASVSELPKEESQTPSTGSKLRHRFEKWVSFGNFQHVAENRFIKRYVEELSNISLILTVEVNGLYGTLALNVPPLPSDRLWYGFRRNPVLSLNVYPKFGTRQISIAPIIQTIENKLTEEFQKALVMPNMDDVVIPFMYAGLRDL